ncbi:MAG TPA: NTP transferase domain-containing protein [Thermoanaerobacterales bacterium]|nr:NTP transferase domain-containing protein [Thermoanaerobacterales bacterium]
MNALILAGKEADGPLKKVSDSKATIKIEGKEMILYVIDALKALDFIQKIAVVGDKAELSFLKERVDMIIEQGNSLTQNILKGAEALPPEEELLVLTCDIPMITPEAIRDFAAKALELEADFCYPIVRREVNDAKYPGVHRTYVRIKDGTFTGGNIVMLKAGTVKKAIDKAEAFLTYRKKPWMLAGILGISFVAKLVLGTLTIKELENKVSGLFGLKARAVISDYPEIGTDVDKESDLELARKVLAGEGCR